MKSGASAMASSGSSGSGLDASCYQQRRDSFTRSLLHFHETRGTPFKKFPELGGRDVDLFKLYNLVTERGGWVKVNRTSGWDDLVVEFNLPKNITNAGAAVKQIYLRYLDRYEKVHFLGENGDRNDDEEDIESRHRRWSARSMHTVSLTYNAHQHNVSDSVRRMSGMSTDLYKGSEFDRLSLSLLSPLPNEQDFAINVCSLLASEGKHALRMDKCPRIIDYLLAHAGVYNHENLRKLFEEIYGRIRRQSIKTFWDDVLESREFAELADESKFRRRRLPRLSLERRALSPEIVSEVSQTPSASIEPDPLAVATAVVNLEDCAGQMPSMPSADSGIDLATSASTQVPSIEPEAPADLNPRPAPSDDGSTPMDVRLEGESDAAVKMEVEEVEGKDDDEVPAPPTETVEEMEERRRKEKEEQTRLRAEEEERLIREEKEAEHFEALRRADEARRSGRTANAPPAASVVRNQSAEHKGLRGRISIEEADHEFFNLGRENGTRDIIGQRVLQVANILRNETFCEETVPILARHQAFIRFLLLCANSRWSNLHQLGMDMLGNIASEIALEDPALEKLTQVMFSSVSRGIRHSDRFVILSSLEFMNKICQRDENEEFVTKAVDQAIYEQVCHMLSLHDIMVLLYTLECLYSLSSMGERPCNYICRARGAIQMLLSLITVEAQSYGPKACIQMKVIETVSGGAPLPPNPPVIVPATPATAVQHKIITPQLMRAPSPKTVVGMPMGAVATPVAIPNPSSVVSVGVTHTPVTVTVPAAVAPTPVSSSVQQQHAHQQTVMENEQFAQAWVRANFELSAGGKVEQSDMYRKYVDWCTSQNRKGVITAMHFPRIVRSVFGGTVGPKVQQTTAGVNTNMPAYDGIQVREVPLTISVKLVPGTEVPTATATATARRRSSNLSNVSPILKAQLVSSSPHPAQVREGSPSPVPGQDPSPVPSDGDNTSLIKSLLASKVTQRQAQAKLLQAQQLQTGQPTVPTAATPKQMAIAKVIRTNGIVQEMQIESNHLPPTEKSKKEPPQPPPAKAVRADAEDSDSMASSSRDYPNMTGVTQSSNEDNDNSLTSFEGIFLNGIDLEAALSEGSKLANKAKQAEVDAPAKPKSQMLADLLDKKDSSVMNGVIGEKGLELVEKAISNNNGVAECGDNRTSSVKVCGKVEEATAKRPAAAASEETGEVPEAKRPKLNTVENNVDKDEVDSKTDEAKQANGEEEVRASSKAANLFAALAAEALEDEEVEVVPQEASSAAAAQPEVRPMIIGPDGAPLLVTGVGGQRQIIMAAPPQAGQVLISAGGQLTLQKQSATASGTQVVSRIVQSGTQQYIVSGNSAQPVLLPQGAGVQGQTVLLTAPGGQQQGTAKTIIILQPQSSASGQPQQKIVLTQSGNVMVGRPVSESPPTIVAQRDVPEVSITQNGGQLHVVRAGSATGAGGVPSSAAATNGVQQIQVISSGVQNNAPILVDKSSPILSDHSVYLCEWRSCMRSFKAASEVYLHVCSCHCPVDPEQETQCLWGRCDGMKRKRFSLMTHLYDRHCNSEVLNVMAMRRRQLSSSGKTEIPVPSPAPPHPGYAPNAAFHAIKRHAGEFTNPKELMPQQIQPGPAAQQRMGAGLRPPPAPPTPPSSASLLAKVTAAPVVVKDDNEGPVTKSIRLTASLILRNLIIYSAIGRRFLKGYEPHLANIALSNVESSRTIAQVLADLNDTGTTGT